MREDANAQYMTILGALGAAIENNKSELALARYEVERLQKKLDEAHAEIIKLKETNNAE